jgi:hypothetical protein
MGPEIDVRGLFVDSPQQKEEGDALSISQPSAEARAISEFFDLHTPGISGFATVILSARGGVHIDLCRSQDTNVTNDALDWSMRALVNFMQEHNIESVGVNTRGGSAGSFIGDDLERMIDALKVLPRVSLEVVCHLNHERAFPFAPAVDRLALCKAFKNMRNIVGLDLRGEWDTAMVLDAVASCENISFLAVRDMKMIDSELDYLADLKSLRKLVLENGEVQGVGFSAIEELPLESLFLSTQYITGRGFEAVSRLSALKEFGIRANLGASGVEGVTVESLKPLGALPSLKVVYSPDIHKSEMELNKLADLKEKGLFPALSVVRDEW